MQRRCRAFSNTIAGITTTQLRAIGRDLGEFRSQFAAVSIDPLGALSSPISSPDATAISG